MSIKPSDAGANTEVSSGLPPPWESEQLAFMHDIKEICWMSFAQDYERVDPLPSVSWRSQLRIRFPIHGDVGVDLDLLEYLAKKARHEPTQW